MLKTRKLNAVIALMIILSMTLYYFVFVGFIAFTYAIDLVQTNNYNIDFSAYFVDENGEKTDVKEKSINEREYLYVDVMVKNEGYFNGYISLSNNNFNIVQDIQSDNIDNISGNTIKLKQINSGETQTIKLLVEPVKDDRINRMSFNANTGVVLSGNYINSKNIETEKNTEINGTAKVNMVWKSSKEISPELTASVLTNSIYELNGEQKRVVQILIDSRVKNNEYPINKTTIKVDGLKNAEQVKAFARSTDATNNQFVFTESNYVYDKVNNIVTINVENNDSDSIAWKKDCADTFVVTYILDKDEAINNQNIAVNGSILTYDQKTLVANTNTVINEEKDGIVTGDIVVKEDSIYKGKIYTGEERAYQTESKIYMNYSELTNKAIVYEKASKYVQNEVEMNANNVYKATSISKSNFDSMLGENGYITIKDENGAVIGNINDTIASDENGNLTLNYNTEVKGLIIETSKPIKEGTLNLVHTKAIRNANLTREVINSLTGIKESSEIKYNDKAVVDLCNKTIELKNTSSKAKFEVEPTKLTATQKNENVKMTVVLENSNEARDLYQNPVIRVKLPSQVKSISAKCKAMYKNGLELSSSRVYKENENYILEIALQGTQTAYSTNVVEGTSIIIYADMEIDENAENSNEEIIMNYTNEIATSFEDNGEEKVGIQIEGIPEEVKAEREAQKAKVLAEEEAERARAIEAQGKLSSTLKAYVGGQELANGDTVYTGEIIKYEITLENNTNADIENLNIQATIPEGTTLVKYVKSSEIQENDTEDIGGLDYYQDLTVENNIINQNINITKNEKKKMYFEIRINKNISTMEFEIKINNNNISKEIKVANKVENSPLFVNVFRASRTEIDYVSEGSVNAYKIEVKNTTNEPLSNINVKILTNSSYTIRNIIDEDDEERKDVDIHNNSILIDKINAGETRNYILGAIVNKNDDFATVRVIADEKYRSNIINEPVKTNNTNIRLSSNTTEKLNVGNNIVYNIEVENTGDIELKGFSVTQLISEYLNVDEVSINDVKTDFTQQNYYNGYFKQIEIPENDEINDYIIGFMYDGELKPKDKLEIKVNTSVNNIKHQDDTEITSIAQVNGTATDTIVHALAATPKEDVEPDDNEDYHYNYDDEADFKDNGEQEKDNSKDEDNNKENQQEKEQPKNENSDTSTEYDDEKYSVSGRVWLDENENGRRDTNEQDINDVQITLLNIDTKNTKKVSNNSTYQFTDLEKGRYIAIFEYDTNKYNLTKYQAENVNKSLNSDVEKNTINIEGNEQLLATTDILNLTNEDISNIDLGLTIAKNFDLELSKTITKVTISNTEGNTVKEYNDSKLAKVEIGAKYLKNSVVAIEYSIKVKNTGEMAGYAKQIVDYKPVDLKFNSSLNSDWYQSGEYIYSNALEKTKLEPGETKELKLVLTKEMTETNTGLTNNMAEINQSASVNNTNDSDSITGNKKSGEDDLGQANVIIGVKTGAAVSYIMVTLSIITMIAIGAFYGFIKVIKETNI